MIKLFFKALRAVLGPLLLAWDKIFPPKRLSKLNLNAEGIKQAETDLVLYQFKSCPFCIKVRRQSKRLHLNLETRNVLKNKAWHDELEQQGGKRKVPCLRIEKAQGEFEWLYNSKTINEYLAERVIAA